MKLFDLLEETKIGQEEYKEQKTTEQLLGTFDEDIDNYRVSAMLGIMLNKIEEDINEVTAPTIRALRRAVNKVKLFESKVEDNGSVTTAYARMRLDSINEEYNTILENVLSKKVARQLNKEALAHSLALLRYQQKNLMREAELERYSIKESTETFEPLIEKELRIVEEAFA